MGGPRDVAVTRITVQEEVANVVRSAATIVVLVWLYLAVTLGDGGDVRRSLLPYQSLIAGRSSTDQRMFRELQEGLLEAETMRSLDGTWPTPDVLAANGIPPFALSPTARGSRYQWHIVRNGASVNYLGLPDSPGAPAWLLLVQEPEPGVPPDQLFEDEEHHKLPDGTMLHVSTWTRQNGTDLAAHLVLVPQAEGWQQLYAVGPSVAPAMAIIPR